MKEFNADTWQANLPCPLGRTEMAMWQGRIDTIAGVHTTGEPNIRLIWGMDGNPEYRVFDRIKQVWRMPYLSVISPEGGADVGVPRFFLQLLNVALLGSPNNAAEVQIAERIEPGSVTAENPNGVTYQEEVRRFAREQYRRLPYIQYMRWSLDDAPDESGIRECCVAKAHQKLACYGDYLAPDQRMLDLISQQVFIARNHAGDAQSAHKYLVASRLSHEIRAQKKRQELAEMNAEFWQSLRNTQQGVRGRWSLPNQPGLIQLAN